MKLVIPLVVFAIFIDVVVCTDLLALEWEYFKVSYNKAYRTDVEHNFRKKIFLQNKKKIDEHNERYEKGEVTYRMGINEFTDMDQEEFNKKVMGGIKWNVTQLSFEENDNVIRFFSPANISVPDVFDWRIKAVVTDVKNQKQCGSCWAFSATGALEGHWAIKHGVLVSLSEQNLVDCSRGFGNQGCNGGLPSQAFMYIKENKGIDFEQAYPYEGKVGQCRYKKPASVATDKGYVVVEKFNEKALMNAVATVGPVSVAIDASHENFMQYKDGVFYQHNCSPVYLSHAVLVVGYGTTSNGNDYWLVKNSWGTSWGMSGYGLMARNRNNNCGIATVATYPLV